MISWIIELENDVKRIYDFGTSQNFEDEYDTYPEYILAVNNKNDICLFKGGSWGK
jgi:hypothetical protein